VAEAAGESPALPAAFVWVPPVAVAVGVALAVAATVPVDVGVAVWADVPGADDVADADGCE
jgi:hypothetical protein